MEQFCEKLIGRYFDAALRAAMTTENKDSSAIASVADIGGDLEKRTAVLASWIRLYRVHRVKWQAQDDNIDQTFADAVARAALEHFDRNQNNLQTVPKAYEDLRHVVEKCYMTNRQKDRSFRSLTGKVLWCAYPDRAPIYDAFASDSITNLTRIYKAYTAKNVYESSTEEKTYDSHCIGDWNSYTGARKDSWWYRDFFHSHNTLYSIFVPSIERRLRDTQNPPSSFRVFDKFLWIFGNPDLDYSLIGYSDGW